mmetsp:Transcript_12754/g.39137  ORF Transcript_12754/g.39137 Transcript_12754/m.39137 type:complete len:261 (-) Transcript_12754:471-1253(-)
MGREVMSLDVLKVDSLSDTRSLVHVASEPVEVWVGHDALLVALEMGYVDSVEPDQCSEQAYIGKSHLGTTQVPRLAQGFFQLIKFVEKGHKCLFICFLSCGKATFVHTIIHRFVEGLCNGIDFIFLPVRKEIDILVCSEVLKFIIQHNYYLFRFVVHYGLRLLVPQNRYGETAVVVFICLEVQVSNLVEFVQRLWFRLESPAHLPHEEIRHSYIDDFIEALQLSCYERPVGPRTRKRHVQVVPACLWLKLASLFDLVSEL